MIFWRACWDRNSRSLGQQIVVDNRRGAGGLIGSTAVAKRHIVARINGDTVKYLATDDMRQRYQQNGAEPMPSTPDEFYKIQRAEYERVRKVIQDIGLTGAVLRTTSSNTKDATVKKAAKID